MTQNTHTNNTLSHIFAEDDASATSGQLSSCETFWRQRKANLSAIVGEKIKCAWCGGSFTKRSYQQVFCRHRGKGGDRGKGNQCKNDFWNLVRKPEYRAMREHYSRLMRR